MSERETLAKVHWLLWRWMFALDAMERKARDLSEGQK